MELGQPQASQSSKPSLFSCPEHYSVSGVLGVAKVSGRRGRGDPMPPTPLHKGKLDPIRLRTNREG